MRQFLPFPGSNSRTDLSRSPFHSVICVCQVWSLKKRIQLVCKLNSDRETYSVLPCHLHRMWLFVDGDTSLSCYPFIWHMGLPGERKSVCSSTQTWPEWTIVYWVKGTQAHTKRSRQESPLQFHYCTINKPKWNGNLLIVSYKDHHESTTNIPKCFICTETVTSVGFTQLTYTKI